MTDLYDAPRGEYWCGEPCVVTNPADPEEAVVICQHLQPARNSASIVLFDAFAVSRGPIASLPLRYPVQPGFHSTFVPSGVRQ